LTHEIKKGPDGKPRFEYKGGVIRLDKEGNWYHDEVKITHQLTADLFSQSIKKLPDGQYCLEVGLECAIIEVEDTPYMVREATIESDRVVIRLNDKSEEELNLDSLRVGDENVLYCDVKSGDSPARFLRPAYYQLMQNLEETDGGYAIRVGEKLWPVKT
jgi:uncharacterized protein